jgi:hypothetical protein
VAVAARTKVGQASALAKRGHLPRPLNCFVLGCAHKVEARGLCGTHLWRLRHKGDVLWERKLNKPYIDKHGYRALVLPKDDPRRAWFKHPTILEHRLVMSEHLGRALQPYESVHHINGDKLDNRLENLQMRTSRHGKGIAMRCCDCGSQNVEAVELDVAA